MVYPSGSIEETSGEMRDGENNGGSSTPLSLVSIRAAAFCSDSMFAELLSKEASVGVCVSAIVREERS